MSASRGAALRGAAKRSSTEFVSFKFHNGPAPLALSLVTNP